MNKINEELKQAKNTIAHLKGQLKVAQKDIKSKDPQSHKPLQQNLEIVSLCKILQFSLLNFD